MSALKDLYREVILDHNKSPRNFRKMPDADNTVEGFNPLCGDHYTVYVKMGGDLIQDVSFEGSGCAISKASGSIMSMVLKGKTRTEAQETFEQFHKLVRGGMNAEDHVEELGKLAAFGGVSEFPARVKCASLAWHTVMAAIEHKTSTVTTE